MKLENNVNLEFGTKVLERDIQLILMQELASVPAFANLILRKDNSESISVTDVWHSITEFTESGNKESDLVVFYESNGAKRFVLIEVKIDAAASDDKQGTGYQERVKLYRDEYNAEGYSLLIAPKRYAGKRDYDQEISFEEIIAFYKDHLDSENESGCLSSRSSFVLKLFEVGKEKLEHHSKNPVNTKLERFFAGYFKLLEQFNQNNGYKLRLKSELQAPSDEREIIFITKVETIRIKHSVSHGLIRLQFQNARKNNYVDEVIKCVSKMTLPDGVNIEPEKNSKTSAKNAGLSFICHTDSIEVSGDPFEQSDKILNCFSIILKLYEFACNLDSTWARKVTQK